MKRWEKIIGGIVIAMGVLFFGSAALVGMIEGLFGIEIISSDNSSPPSSYEDEVPKDEVETQPETHVCDYQLISSTPADYESSQVNYYKCLICDKNYNENVGKPKAPIEFFLVSHEQDCVGGNTLQISIKNLTDTKIEWIDFTMIFLNVKGEILKDTIRRWSEVSWYDGPIDSNEVKHITCGIFYNSNFKGNAAPIQIIIHFINGAEIKVELNDILEKYDKPLFYYSASSKVLVNTTWYYYHVISGDCEYYKDIQKENNILFEEMTIAKALSLGKARCPECMPY